MEQPLAVNASIKSKEQKSHWSAFPRHRLQNHSNFSFGGRCDCVGPFSHSRCAGLGAYRCVCALCNCTQVRQAVRWIRWEYCWYKRTSLNFSTSFSFLSFMIFWSKWLVTGRDPEALHRFFPGTLKSDLDSQPGDKIGMTILQGKKLKGFQHFTYFKLGQDTLQGGA